MVVMRSMTINACYRPYTGLSIHAAPNLMMALHFSVLLYCMKAWYKR
jgi:hypothetical protein